MDIMIEKVNKIIEKVNKIVGEVDHPIRNRKTNNSREKSYNWVGGNARQPHPERGSRTTHGGVPD